MDASRNVLRQARSLVRFYVAISVDTLEHINATPVHAAQACVVGAAVRSASREASPPRFFPTWRQRTQVRGPLIRGATPCSMWRSAKGAPRVAAVTRTSAACYGRSE